MTVIPEAPGTPAAGAPDRHDVRVDSVHVERVSVRIGRSVVLDEIDLDVATGALVAIAGGSGAGKTTLLETMAGLRRPTSGRALVGPERRPAHELAGSGRVGVVPQDDIIHRDLPLRRTLIYAARIRLGGDDRGRTDAIVDEVLARLGLTSRADVLVGSLSGGQRKRASIAVELLTRPEVLFLDEPTSGLDPVSAAEVIEALRALTRRGTTVVMTTHDPAEIARCDDVAFLAPGGRLCFSGRPSDALVYFEVDDLAAVYGQLAGSSRVATDEVVRARPATEPPGPRARSPRPGPSGVRQWAVLTTRAAEVMARNRLTLAILLGSPAMVITLMAVLFTRGTFDTVDPSAPGPPETVFWLAFSAFFFGLTYGLLQIVTERAVLRRERFAGLNLAAYFASKVAVLLPMLVVVDAALLGVLRLLDRLPALDGTLYAQLLITLGLISAAGLVIGLVASAAVADPTQATLALPMICFPQVLFAGAVVPVDQMAGPGAAMSIVLATRWGFESLGRTRHLAPASAASAGPYHQAFTGSVAIGWIVLGIIIAVATIASLVVLHARTARAGLSRA